MTMSEQPNYHKATNAAYEILANATTFSLSTDILNLCRRYPHISIHTYTQLADKFDLSFCEFLEIASSEYGVTFRDPKTGRIQIWYNDMKSSYTIRFTLAHELGHAVLEHIEDDDTSRKEASCFARNLLCAVPIIDELEIQSIDDLVYVFDVGDLMAEISLNYFSSDRYYIKTDTYRYLRDRTAAYMYGCSSVAELYGLSYS